MVSGRQRWLDQAEANTRRRQREAEVLLQHLREDHKDRRVLDTDGLEELERTHTVTHLKLAGEQ